MRYLILILCVAGLMGFTRVASAQADDGDKTQQLAAAGKWADAIEAYAKSLAPMSAAQYRDKKDFSWILEEYEKKSAGDYAPMQKVVADLLAKNKGQELIEWRLHRLLAEIAQKQGDKEAQAKALDQAIATYNSKIEGDPAKHSSLQHLYNERAMLMADKDPKAAEEYILKAFKADKRFVYFFGLPWARFYQEMGQPQAYQKLLQQVRKTYDQKAATDPKNAGLLKRYAVQLSQELKGSQG